MVQEAAKRNLVLVRAGSEHRLHGLLGVPRSARNWDLAISQYDELNLEDGDCVDFVHFHEGGKWDGIFAFFRDHPELPANYDYFWLVDDDIEANAELTDQLFEYVTANSFEISQPSLTLDSYNSYRITLQCRMFRHRQTNFVELMMPVLSRDVLMAALPLFKDTRSGRGIDWIWYRYAKRPRQSVAIIDEVAFAHRRPLRSHLRGRMRKDGVCADMEKATILRKSGIRLYYPVAFAGLLKDGRSVSTRLGMAYHMWRAYTAGRREMTATPWRLADYVILLFLQLIPRRVFRKDVRSVNTA